MSIATDSNGVKSAEQLYTAWGTARYASTPGFTTSFRFTGQRRENYLDLYWYGSRWYDPSAARFIQADTLIPGNTDTQAYDRYAYTSNNPVKYTDPSGHRNCEEDGYCPSNNIQENNLTTSNTSDPKTNPNPIITSETKTPNPPNINKNIPTQPVSAEPIPIAPSRTPIPSTKTSAPSGGFLWGVNYSGAGLNHYVTGGMDEVVLLNGTRATYNYMGQGQMAGGGANASVYGGIVFNVDSPEDYIGQTTSCGLTGSLGPYGITIDAFWSNPNDPMNPFTPDIPKGFTIGWAPGAEAGAFCVYADYEETWQYPK